MRIFIASQGAREEHLRALCTSRGHQVTDHGPWHQVVLALPRSSMPEELSFQLPAGQKIVCGITDAAFDQLAEKRHWHLLRVLQDGRYTQENAALSAEGAIFAAMSRAPFALHGARCLVVGYGRIGRALSDMLRGLGARVAVAARRAESRIAAGSGSIAIDEIPSALPGVQFLFNTVPAPILGKEWLTLVSPDAFLIELASPPYGIDLDAAKELGLHAWLESGIPGRYCPQSAAAALLRYMEQEDRP